ncbi:MAG: hypothetical protein FJ030_08385 [Chloroflexi bacterium]|nr:hypothetical protein [Chloroflexota bacterium]
MRWLLRNLSALLLSLALAVTIWVVAINEEDPFEEKVFADPVPITITHLPQGMVIVGSPRLAADIRVRAPQSVWASLKIDQLHVVADLSNAAPGTVTVPLAAVVDAPHTLITNIAPQEIQLTLEPIINRELPLRLEINGEPATGYKLREVATAPESVIVSGPASAADSVSELIAQVDVSNAKQTVTEVVGVTPVNAAGQPVFGITLAPSTVAVTVPVEQLGGYRDVAVKAVIEGQVAAGYRLTNISVSPPVVTLFSSDPTIVAALAGFVETEKLDISKASDDLEVRATLVLPEGVSLVGEQTVVVQISIAAIESSLTIQHDLEIQGLGAGLAATASPSAVDVILSGPLPILDSLTHESVRVVLDLLGLPPGLHQVTPQVVAPEGVTVQTILPGTIEVLITGSGTATRAPTAASPPPTTRLATATATRAPTLTPTPTGTP